MTVSGGPSDLSGSEGCRQDLLDAVKGSNLPIRPIQDIKAEVQRICGGKPERPKRGESSGGDCEVGRRNRARRGLANCLGSEHESRAPE